jgi:gluconolactonase
MSMRLRSIFWGSLRRIPRVYEAMARAKVHSRVELRATAKSLAREIWVPMDVLAGARQASHPTAKWTCRSGQACLTQSKRGSIQLYFRLMLTLRVPPVDLMGFSSGMTMIASMRVLLLVLLMACSSGLGVDGAGVDVSVPNSEPFAKTAKLEVIATGFGLAEGPVWYQNQLLVSDIPANTVFAFSSTNQTVFQRTVFQKPSGNANGHRLDAQGRLLQAEHGRQVTRLESDGTRTVLASKFDGKRLNSPNDLVVHGNGSIYFSDPTWGLGDPSQSELGFTGIYRITNGTVTLLNKTLEQPNGLAFSRDQKTLYVSDATNTIRAFPVLANGDLGAPRDFAKGNDGLVLDAQGRVWAANGGVSVYGSDGKLISSIARPGSKDVTNLAFGGADGKTLFVTTFDAVYKLQTQTTAN